MPYTSNLRHKGNHFSANRALFILIQTTFRQNLLKIRANGNYTCRFLNNNHYLCTRILKVKAIMIIEDVKAIIQGDETRTLEVKKTTGELKDGMRSACAFLNTAGGWLFFGYRHI